jgi:hypothetical protein
MVSNFQEINP